MRPGKFLVCIVAGVMPIVAPMHLFAPRDQGELISATTIADPAEAGRARPPARPRPGAAVYGGLGAWVDVYDKSPWRNPRRAVRTMKAHGVRTLYLQTSNHRLHRDLFRPAALSAFLDAAHKRSIAVVAWYAPSFADLGEDRKRSLAALRFRSRAGARFDSVALDIEVPMVADISLRNRRLLWLSDQVRKAAGRRYPLGAIVPEAGASYWPRFPYRAVARRFDVFLPMAYWTYRTSGAAAVSSFITRNVATVHSGAGPRVRVHVIGGIAGDGPVEEVRAFVRAARRSGAVGASLYDFPITTAGEWREMRGFRRR